MVSVLIPARYEPTELIQRTIDSVLHNAAGDIEVIVGLDGYWPSPIINDHPNVIILHESKPIGMRQLIMNMMRISHGRYIMKCDAHCHFCPGFDKILLADCDDNWVCTLRQYSLNGNVWKKDANRVVDYWYMEAPDEDNPCEKCWRSVALRSHRWHAKKNDKQIDDQLTFQGSCWFIKKDYFIHLCLYDIENYGYFACEASEIGNKAWLDGGRVIVNKNGWFAHLHNKRYWSRHCGNYDETMAKSVTFNYFLWMKQHRDFMHSLIDRFAPVPGWDGFKW